MHTLQYVYDIQFGFINPAELRLVSIVRECSALRRPGARISVDEISSSLVSHCFRAITVGPPCRRRAEIKSSRFDSPPNVA